MLRLSQEVVKEEVVKEDEEEILEEVEYTLTEEDLARLKEPIEGFIDGGLKLMSQYIYYGPKKNKIGLEYIIVKPTKISKVCW